MKRDAVTKIPIPDVQRDGVEHWPVMAEWQRCKHSMCSLKSSLKCLKCQVHLCLNKNTNGFTDFNM